MELTNFVCSYCGFERPFVTAGVPLVINFGDDRVAQFQRFIVCDDNPVCAEFKEQLVARLRNEGLIPRPPRIPELVPAAIKTAKRRWGWW